MVRAEYLFWVCLVLSVLSFLLFGMQIVVSTFRVRRANAGGMADAEQHTISPTKVMEEMGDLAHSFAKAGPMSTAAALSVMFALIALVSSGVIKIE